MPETNFFEVVETIFVKDTRYKPDSYEFILQALYFTQENMQIKGHVTGKELSEGIRKFALKQYGAMARTVLGYWGIFKTEDFGNIVFNMIDEGLLSQTPTDSLEDFKDVYSFDDAFAFKVPDIII